MFSGSFFLAICANIAAITTAGWSDGVDGEVKTPFAEHDKNVKEFLDTMQFEDYAVNSYYHLNRLPNSAGVAVAHKTIKDGDRKWTLLAVLPMSACYRDEWAGNFDVGPGDGSGNGVHEGFKAGSDEILRFVKQYVAAMATRIADPSLRKAFTQGS